MEWLALAMERGVRIEWLKETVGEEEIVGGFFGVVGEWWKQRFSGMSLPQRLAVPAIGAGRNVLVCAPTGTGKTLCAFISILSDLMRRRAEGTLLDGVDTVYVSPLRALGTDITRNLVGPLGEMAAMEGGVCAGGDSGGAADGGYDGEGAGGDGEAAAAYSGDHAGESGVVSGECGDAAAPERGAADYH